MRRPGAAARRHGCAQSVVRRTPRAVVVHREPGRAPLVLTHPVTRERLHPVGVAADDLPTDRLVVTSLHRRVHPHGSNLRPAVPGAQRPRSRKADGTTVAVQPGHGRDGTVGRPGLREAHVRAETARSATAAVTATRRSGDTGAWRHSTRTGSAARCSRGRDAHRSPTARQRPQRPNRLHERSHAGTTLAPRDLSTGWASSERGRRPVTTTLARSGVLWWGAVV